MTDESLVIKDLTYSYGKHLPLSQGGQKKGP